VRFRWESVRPALQADLLAGQYRFSPLRRVRGAQSTVEVWHALDALVLKAMALVLRRHLDPHLSRHCHNLSGTGGAKAAVPAVAGQISANTFVFRTDVKSYYASIDHQILVERLAPWVNDPLVLALVRGYLERTVCDGGEYVDDWVTLAPTRWKLRAVIRLVNQHLARLKVRQRPDKTFIGRIERGFDFLGYWFSPRGLGIARPTRERCAARIRRLYEQGASESRIDEYERRWWRWIRTEAMGRKEHPAMRVQIGFVFLAPILGRCCNHDPWPGVWVFVLFAAFGRLCRVGGVLVGGWGHFTVLTPLSRWRPFAVFSSLIRWPIRVHLLVRLSSQHGVAFHVRYLQAGSYVHLHRLRLEFVPIPVIFLL
jgi:RNA-directed DNA polymerase